MKLQVGRFKQRTRTFFSAADGLDCLHITAVALLGDTLFVGTENGLYINVAGRFIKTAVTHSVTFLKSVFGKLWCSAGGKVYAFENGEIVFEQNIGTEIVGIDDDGERLWLISSEKVHVLENEKFVPYTKIEYGKVTSAAAANGGRLYVGNYIGILAMHGKRPHWGVLNSESCSMPECQVNCLATDRIGNLWVGTDNGVLLYDGTNKWYTKALLPYLTEGNTFTITIAEDGSRYIGTDYGLVIQDGVRESCYVPGRWLPDGRITSIAVSHDSSKIYVGTQAGLALIENKEMTLADKAKHFEDFIEEHHIREGYCAKLCLHGTDNLSNAVKDVSDNDGLWTGVYVATEAYRFAVTGDADAKEKARRGMNAMLKLMSITDIPGFTARAYRRPNEHSFGDGNIEWHETHDEMGVLEWKGETSSDEMVGHFFGASTYFDLCADEDEKKRISTAICAIVDHILSHGYTLCDADGLSTTWAHWSPSELNRDDMWSNERGINSLELMTMLLVANHMSGNSKYLDERNRLIRQEHYALNAAKHKIYDAHVCHIDDDLGFLTSITIFKYETDAHLRQLLLFGLKDHWNYVRCERAPLWNLAYGAITGDFCDLDKAARSLIELPLDFTSYNIKNSRRPSLNWDSGQEKFDGEPQLKEPLPYDEKPISSFDGNPFFPDERHTHVVRMPIIFLLPYWFGRYHGLLDAD